jgi:hypothetical protein
METTAPTLKVLQTPRADIDHQIDRLVKWFRPRLATEQGDMIAYKLRKYPIRAWQRAVDQCIEDKRPTPSQFPTISELRRLMDAYCISHSTGSGPGGQFTPTPCSDCNGRGLLWFKREYFDLGPIAVDDQGVATKWPEYEHVAKCAKCDNSKQHGALQHLKTLDKSELIKEGKRVFPYGT